ncbi:protein PHLOEM PROTEIN 2-LIKE A9-like [Benincasa hispida]|uniref:protein PHLOEM PROTEIN 2-LIKE A9-like n=1 Tax=Benincasa hispida TaxID=102211 RepID=UPI001901B123|nr:protein PHLOEM PROTEIN 2-LIKE A9-like [Benincasa hispida]
MAKFSTPHYDADPKAIETIKGIRTVFYPRAFNITWGNDNRYWRFPQNINLKDPKSVVQLLQVSWLEVTCSTDNVEVGKTYKVGFNLSLQPDAFGWNEVEVFIMAKVGKKGNYIFKKTKLGNKPTNTTKFCFPEEGLEIKVVAPPSSPGDSRLYFGLYEVWSGKWKGGLQIHNAFVHKI